MTTIDGRREPRPPEVTEHDVRFGARPGGTMYAKCNPCRWSVWVANDHTADDFKRLERMHTGHD